MKVVYSYRNKGFYDMRKSIVLLMVLFILFSFCSCLTTDSFSGVNRNSYSSYSYSTKYSKEDLTKEDELVFLVGTPSYVLNRSLETELKKQFEEQGISIRIGSDYVELDNIDMMSEEEVSESFIQLMTKNEDQIIRYFGLIGVNDLYIYEYGGGIKNIQVSVYIMDGFSGPSTVERIDVDIKGKENNYEDYNSSMETVVKLISKEIVEEYTKYLTPTT